MRLRNWFRKCLSMTHGNDQLKNRLESISIHFTVTGTHLGCCYWFHHCFAGTFLCGYSMITSDMKIIVNFLVFEVTIRVIFLSISVCLWIFNIVIIAFLWNPFCRIHDRYTASLRNHLQVDHCTPLEDF